MKGQRIIATAVAVVFACTGFVVGGSPAAAAPTAVSAPTAGVPPAALPACAEPGESGGWDVRDFVSDGSLAEQGGPVRPRSIVLSEPCVGESGEISIPFVASDPEPPILDEDDDGQDDGGPTGGFERVCGSATMIDMCIQYTGTIMVSSTEYLCFRTTTFAGADQVGVISVPVQVVGQLGNIFNGSASSRVSGAFYEAPCRAQAGAGPSSSWLAVGSDDDVVVAYAVGNNCIPGPGNAECGPVAGETDYGDGYYGGTQGADTTFGHTTDEDDSFVVCATSYTGEGTPQPMTDGAFLGADAIPFMAGLPGFEELTFAGLFVNPGVWTGIAAADCPYVVSITLRICTYSLGEIAGCAYLTWDADRWREHRAYPDVPSGLELACTVYPDAPGCYEVLNPTVVDGSSFDEVCGDPPEAAWLDFSWLPEVIGYYAQCLFIPANGWDRLGWMASAWEASPLGSIGAIVEDLTTAMSISETCGPFGGDAGGGYDFTMSTCDWTWAGPMKVVLTFAFIIGVSFWVIRMVIRMVIGIPNRKVVDPTDGGN